MAELIGVVLGGVLAVGGGASTQWLMHKMRADSERSKTREEKFQDIIAAVFEYDQWLDIERQRLVLGTEMATLPTPMAKLYALTMLYFPEVDDQIRELENSAVKYQYWMAEAGDKRVKNLTQEFQDKVGAMGTSYKPYLQARRGLLDKLKEVGSTIIKDIS